MIRECKNSAWPEQLSSGESPIFNHFQIWRKKNGKYSLPVVTLKSFGQSQGASKSYGIFDVQKRCLGIAELALNMRQEDGYTTEGTILYIEKPQREFAVERCLGTSAFVVSLEVIHDVGALPVMQSLTPQGKHIFDQLVGANILQVDEPFSLDVGTYIGMGSLRREHRRHLPMFNDNISRENI